MSVYSRSNYDKCAIDEQHKRSIGPGNYHLYAGAVINPKFNNGKGSVCDKKGSCKKMTQPNATLGLGQDDISRRVALEGELRGTNRILSKCSADEWYPCTLGGKTGDKEGCPSIVMFNPAINERDLFETNMNVEYEQGFGPMD